MVLKAGQTYKVTVQVTPSEDVHEAVVDAAISNGIYNEAPVEAVDVGYYIPDEQEQEEIINL